MSKLSLPSSFPAMCFFYRIHRAFFIISGLLLVVRSAAGTPFFLAPTGNDSSDGKSPQTAWRTLDRASRHQFSPGDVLLLQGGAQFTGALLLTAEDAGTPQRPVTITSFGNGRAIIVNPDTSAISIRDAGGIVIRNLIIQSPDRTRNRGCGVRLLNTLPKADKRPFIRLDSLAVSGFGQDGIWLGGQPADSSQSGFTDVRISRCVLFDNQYHGLFVTGIWDTHSAGYANHNLLITHCTAYENTGDPAYLANHSGSGMEIDNVEDAVIEYCAAYRNGFLCNARVGGPCGIWLHAANRSVIRHCVAIGNRTGRGIDGAGFDLDGGTTNCRIEYCYARDNEGAGILVWNYEYAPHRLGDNVIRYNILENNGKANNYADIHIGTSGTAITNMVLHNNTVLTSRQPTGKQRCVWVGENVQIGLYNNLLLTNGGAPSLDLPKNAFRVKQAGNTTGPVTALMRLSNTNSAESPTPGTLRKLRAYRPLAGSSLLLAGVSLNVLGIRIGDVDFWGHGLPPGDRSVGAGGKP